jgi:hypothetical protein
MHTVRISVIQNKSKPGYIPSLLLIITQRPPFVLVPTAPFYEETLKLFVTLQNCSLPEAAKSPELLQSFIYLLRLKLLKVATVLPSCNKEPDKRKVEDEVPAWDAACGKSG